MKKLKYYGGQGWENSPGVGNFEVSIYSDEEANENGSSPLETRIFISRSAAKEFYESYNGQKSAWDCSSFFKELIESHSY